MILTLFIANYNINRKTMESELILKINTITQQIEHYEKLLAEARHQLFMSRILTMVNEISTVSTVTFSSNGTNWTIAYKCTVTYDENNYNHNDDSEADTEPYIKTFEISFGKGKRYFINGNQLRFKIYRNSTNKLRILNADYTADLDIDEQEILINSYSYNYNIPEWFAIRILLFMEKNEWSDENLITYLDL